MSSAPLDKKLHEMPWALLYGLGMSFDEKGRITPHVIPLYWAVLVVVGAAFVRGAALSPAQAALAVSAGVLMSVAVVIVTIHEAQRMKADLAREGAVDARSTR